MAVVLIVNWIVYIPTKEQNWFDNFFFFICVIFIYFKLYYDVPKKQIRFLYVLMSCAI